MTAYAEHLIAQAKPGAAMWKKAQAERRFKQQHAFALEADKCYVAELCLTHTSLEQQVSTTAIMGERRIRKVKDTRHIAMTVAYELSGLSTIALGKLFNRDHTMILHAQRRVNTSSELRAQADKVVMAVRRELKCPKK